MAAVLISRRIWAMMGDCPMRRGLARGAQPMILIRVWLRALASSSCSQSWVIFCLIRRIRRMMTFVLTLTSLMIVLARLMCRLLINRQ